MLSTPVGTYGALSNCSLMVQLVAQWGPNLFFSTYTWINFFVFVHFITISPAKTEVQCQKIAVKILSFMRK